MQPDLVDIAQITALLSARQQQYYCIALDCYNKSQFHIAVKLQGFFFDALPAN